MRGGGWLPIAIAAVSLAFGVYTYLEGKERAENAEERNDLRMARSEAKARLQTQKEYNRAIGAYNRGIMIGKKELLEARRERQAGLKSYGFGEPTRS